MSVIKPEVFATHFSVSFVAGLIVVISSTGAFASFIAVVAAVALIFALLGDWAPNFVFVVGVFATVWSAHVSPFAVRSVRVAAVLFVFNASVGVWAPNSVSWAAVGVTFLGFFAPGESVWFITAVFRAGVSVFAP